MNDDKYFFFRMDHCLNDPYPDFAVAKSYEHLVSRYGRLYVGSFFNVTQLNEVTLEHLLAIDELLDSIS